jgi:hypothetical protein
MGWGNQWRRNGCSVKVKVKARGEECRCSEAKKVGNKAKTQYIRCYPQQLKAVPSERSNMGHY